MRSKSFTLFIIHTVIQPYMYTFYSELCRNRHYYFENLQPKLTIHFRTRILKIKHTKNYYSVL